MGWIFMVEPPACPQHGYQVRVKGCLSAEIIERLDCRGVCDFTLGETILTLFPADQAALYGLMNRLRDLALTLVSVSPIEQHESDNSSFA